METEGACTADVIIDGVTIHHSFQIMAITNEQFPYDGILGIDFLQLCQANINFECNKISIPKNIKSISTNEINNTEYITKINDQITLNKNEQNAWKKRPIGLTCGTIERRTFSPTRTITSTTSTPEYSEFNMAIARAMFYLGRQQSDTVANKSPPCNCWKAELTKAMYQTNKDDICLLQKCGELKLHIQHTTSQRDAYEMLRNIGYKIRKGPHCCNESESSILAQEFNGATSRYMQCTGCGHKEDTCIPFFVWKTQLKKRLAKELENSFQEKSITGYKCPRCFSTKDTKTTENTQTFSKHLAIQATLQMDNKKGRRTYTIPHQIQLELDEESREKTAFSTSSMHVEYTRMCIKD